MKGTIFVAFQPHSYLQQQVSAFEPRRALPSRVEDSMQGSIHVQDTVHAHGKVQIHGSDHAHYSEHHSIPDLPMSNQTH